MKVSMQFASKVIEKMALELSQHYLSLSLSLSLSLTHTHIHRKSISFSSLARRLQAQTTDVPSSLSLSAELLQTSLFWLLK